MDRKHILGLGLAIPAVAAVLGCGDSSGLPRRYPVSGQVSYNGKPLARGSISFAPVNPQGRAAGGTIVDGRYALTTQDSNDGALTGSYRVSIQAKETDPSKVDLTQGKKGIGGPLTGAQQKALIAAYPQLRAGKAAAAARNLIPSKYSSPETSGLTYEVKEQSDTSANFNLKDD
jgi:hypothetical protein